MEHILKSRYRIAEKISENPFSVTYKGTLLGSNKPIVIKIYKRGTLNSSLIRDMKQKVKDLTLISYHGIAKLLDGDYGWQGFYYVREYIEGKSLHEIMTGNELIGEEKALLITEESARALEYAHSRGIIHGALKPSNIILDSQGVVHLADFVIEGEIKESIPQKVLTIMQNAYYASPEELLGKPATASSDVYSLGLIFIEMLLGRPVFNETGLKNNLEKLRSATVLNSETLAVLPQYLREILKKALVHDPVQRFTRISEFRESLEKRMLVGSQNKREDYSELFETTVARYGEEDIKPEAEILEDIGQTKIKWGKEKHRTYILTAILALSVISGILFAFLWGR